MLDFICELERVVSKWPENASRNLAQIADQTATGVPQVVDILSDTLDRELEVHEALTRAEAVKALDILKDRMSGQLQARAKRLEVRREKAIRAFDLTMEKVRVLQAAKNWRSAYKTLSYYVGRHEKDLPSELMLSLCGECLRLGFKAEANLQELSLWLRKGVAACLITETASGVEEALDFIDAYGELFQEEQAAAGGRRLLGSVMEGLKREALSHNLAPQYEVLAKDLGVG